MSITPIHLSLAEDDRNDAFFLLRAFEKGGFARPAKTFSDGQELMRHLSGTGPYADRVRHPLPTHLLLDLKLPRYSGLELLEWIRKSSPIPELPVIILTSSDRSEDRERVEAMVVDGYFVKPSRYGDLVDLVQAIAKVWTLPRVGSGVPQ
ncbi:MAG: response regulator [Planctomycetota bacterium]|nr:MAG: response regulator [Planctomycetota bacterium]